MNDRGHLFAINGDLTKLACDAILIPTDRWLAITSAWSSFLGMDEPGFLDHAPFPDNKRVMRFAGAVDELGPHVWLGEVGAVTQDAAWYSSVLEEFVTTALADLSEASGGRAVPWRLAVNLAGSGQGGFSHDKGALVRSQLATLGRLAAEHGVDIVLVCHGAAMYSAVQRMRYLDGGQPTFDDSVEAAVDRVAGHARLGELVLFVGAGVSMGAGVASWDALLTTLLHAVDEPRPSDEAFGKLGHLERATYVERRLGVERFRELLGFEIQRGTRYSLAHGLLASLGTTENVTTNYDTLFEAAAAATGEPCTVLPDRPVGEVRRWLLKLHGSIDPPTELVLTRSDYLGLPKRSGALLGVLQAMLMTRHMLFVGYSLNDDTFHRVMHEVREARQLEGLVGTVLSLHENELMAEIWRDDLELVPVTGDGSASPAAAAARHLEIVLDEVARRAASSASYLLDPSYDALLDDSERSLRDALLQARQAAAATRGSVGDEVAGALKRFGAHGQGPPDR